MAHAIGFDGDVALQIVAPDGREVIGAIERGGGVELSADALEVLLDAVALRIIEGSLPLNIMCSSRCVAPVVPVTSLREPTR